MNGVAALRRLAGSAGRILPVERLSELLGEWERAATSEPAASGSPVAGSARGELITLGTYVLGAGLATVGSVTRAARLPAAVPALTSVAANVPQLREVLRARLGAGRAERLVATGESVLGVLAGQPAGLLVTAIHSGQKVLEAQARERVWARRAPGLFTIGGTLAEDPAAAGRPVPLPAGPVERYAAQAASAGLAGLAGGVVTGRPALRMAALAGASAKAARLTKESWAARVARAAANHDLIIVDPQAFRRLDRVDTVVIEASLLTTGRLAVEEVVPLAEVTDADGESVDLYGMALTLLTPDAPAPEGWELTPAARSGPAPYRELARRLTPGGALFTLHHDGRAVAAVTAAPELDPYADAVVAAAQRVGPVWIAGVGSRLDRRLDVAGAVPAGNRLAEQVRELQAAGHGVILVADAGTGTGAGQRQRAALTAADCGVAVVGTATLTEPPGGHLACGPGLAEVPRLLAAVPSARRAAQAGVLTASYGAATGALVGLSGLGGQAQAGRNALVATNLAALAGIITGAWYADPVVRGRPANPIDRIPWHAVPVPEVLRRLGSSLRGLSTGEADRRHHAAGDDIPPDGMVRATAHELDNPLTPALTAGAGLAAASGSTLDSVLIGAVLGVNALVGGAQRWGAGRAVRRLAGQTAVPLRLWRDNHQISAPAQELVRGDVIELRAGDAVPADARLLAADGLELDEASLTGESLPVAKSAEPSVAREPAERHSMVYEGTAIAAGRARAAVVATGEATQSHQAEALADPPPAGGVQARLAELTNASLKLSFAGGAALLAANLLRGRPLSDSITAAVSLTVAAVPEGLPSVATVAQLSAANRLSRRGVLVRNPTALESLGRLQTLCFDKTGTLTEGALRLRMVADDGEQARAAALSPRLRSVLAAALRATPPPASSGRRLPHPTDQAVVTGGQEAGVTEDYDRPEWTRVDELPFEPARGFHAVLGSVGDEHLLSVKGAPEVVLEMCTTRRTGGELRTMRAADRRRLTEAATDLARRGHRVLAVAEGDTPAHTPMEADTDLGELAFVGFVALADRARPAAAAAVATLTQAGVRVVMVTGDHPSTAEAVAAELGLLNGGRVMTGAELDECGDEELRSRLPEVTVFARVDPGHKVRVVRLLRAAGEVVAVTGDGANDAPAIRSADVGMALGTRATAAARQAADVVVTDDQIETIVDAIVEGRILWSSVREAVSVLLGGNLGEIGFTVGAGMVGAASLRPRQLLLVNMLTDVAPAMALAARQPPGVTPETLLAEGPTSSLGEQLTRDIRTRATATASAAAMAWLAARLTGTETRAATVALIALVCAQLGQTLLVGWRDPVVVAACVGSLAVLIGAVQVPLLSQLLACRPVGPIGWGIALTAAAGTTLAVHAKGARSAVS
ncbi:cation-translocating P-type ATPase [Natronosporangium hydrolyticum]|uniref:cation-translocating P-type ATPase n=1 Tax=Natronosporangium hydrolyticum TaxID=2811111 RepID=UPI001EFA0CF8|nr:cation-translocating P-type ATPase [Natronosporangium hydrolyticum]